MPNELAVLISGGLDSAMLLGDALRHGTTIHPLFLRFGLGWEVVELEYLQRFLDALAGPTLKPLRIFDQPVGDIYGQHWSVTGNDVPDATVPRMKTYSCRAETCCCWPSL